MAVTFITFRDAMKGYQSYQHGKNQNRFFYKTCSINEMPLKRIFKI